MLKSNRFEFYKELRFCSVRTRGHRTLGARPWWSQVRCLGNSFQQ